MKYGCIWIFLALLLAGCANTPVSITDTKQNTSKSTNDLLGGVELKKAKDIEKFLSDKKVGGIKDYAQALADVDEWLFSPDEDVQVKKLLEKEVSELRTRIESEVDRLLKAATEANNGKVATGHISKINLLIPLYPSPTSEVHHAWLDQLANRITDTSKRVEDIRRLRYNEWAIKRIQFSLEHYHYEVKISNTSDLKKLLYPNKGALINKCVEGMAILDPAYLEPAVMDLYNYAYGKTRSAMGDDEIYMIKLANGFANPANKRITPSDF